MAKKKNWTNTAYDIAKWFTLIFMPAGITLTSIIMQTTEAANIEQTITILTAINTFLGAILGISNINYNAKIANSQNKSV